MFLVIVVSSRSEANWCCLDSTVSFEVLARLEKRNMKIQHNHGSRAYT